ncbi:hypothetical protein M1M11_02560 [Pseudomonas azerbaijanoccidens]|uniref:hypothetical protein n=1 Tax=Pseudomonas azerbaijanoccidentalis TaxID=2842347 RepID=UPI00200A04BB|nr:hypothetical protein [Pseudomonas azerbaijanoccidentalis]MCK8663760.1 hypothetical protein [Pseudomonas azerbaijanoccidentalis]
MDALNLRKTVTFFELKKNHTKSYKLQKNIFLIIFTTISITSVLNTHSIHAAEIIQIEPATTASPTALSTEEKLYPSPPSPSPLASAPGDQGTYALAEPHTKLPSLETSPLIHNELVAIHDQLEKLKPWYAALYPGIFALLGILTGGGISVWIQRGQRKHDTAERLKKSGFEAKLKLIEYRSKQVNEFYGPMLVLLKQSKELSTQLHAQLSKDAPDRYSFKTDPTSKAGQSLFICQAGEPDKVFRLISELPYLGKNHSSALPRVKVIIDTGERMAKIIEEKSGLVKPSSQVLIGCLGIYLAHLTALKDAYSLTEKTKKSGPQRTHEAVFPREIEDLTRNDYDDLIGQIKEWETSVDNLLLGAK